MELRGAGIKTQWLAEWGKTIIESRSICILWSWKATLLRVPAKPRMILRGQSFDAPWKMILTTVWLQFGAVKRSFWRRPSYSGWTIWFLIAMASLRLMHSAPNGPQWWVKLPLLIPPSDQVWLLLSISVFCQQKTRGGEDIQKFTAAVVRGATNSELHFQGIYYNQVHFIITKHMQQ